MAAKKPSKKKVSGKSASHESGTVIRIEPDVQVITIQTDPCTVVSFSTPKTVTLTRSDSEITLVINSGSS